MKRCQAVILTNFSPDGWSCWFSACTGCARVLGVSPNPSLAPDLTNDRHPMRTWETASPIFPPPLTERCSNFGSAPASGTMDRALVGHTLKSNSQWSDASRFVRFRREVAPNRSRGGCAPQVFFRSCQSTAVPTTAVGAFFRPALREF